jgi:hypothetical protein
MAGLNNLTRPYNNIFEGDLSDFVSASYDVNIAKAMR